MDYMVVYSTRLKFKEALSMKSIKKIIAVVMAVVLVFCSFSFVVSAKNDEEKEYVATVYVCQRATSYYLNGHTWLYFKNLTNHTITVGVYPLPKGQGVSVGTFGTLVRDGRGLYYNIESYRYNILKWDDFVCLKKNVTEEQLARMSWQITRNGIWTYLLNCSFSAFTTWDIVLGKFIPYLIFPLLARLCILMYPQHESGFFMYNPKPDQVFKQVGYGSKAYLKPTDPRHPDWD